LFLQNCIVIGAGIEPAVARLAVIFLHIAWTRAPSFIRGVSTISTTQSTMSGNSYSSYAHG